MPKPPNLPHPSSSSPLKVLFLLGAGWLALSLGCESDRVAHYRVPKEAPVSHPDHPGHEDHAMPSQAPSSADQPPSAAPAGEGSLKWTLPKGWTEGPGGNMQVATLVPPIPGNVKGSVSFLAGAAGGELPNVNRWRNQIGLPPIEEGQISAFRSQQKSKAGLVTVYDFSRESQGTGHTVVGSIATADGKTWFIKLTGEPSLVAKAKPDFMRILGSLRLD